MDKNTIIGLLIIFGLFLGYSFYSTNKTKKAREEQEKELATQVKNDSDSVTAQMDSAKLTAKVDSVSSATTAPTASNKTGVFGFVDSAKTADYVVNTNIAQYQFSKTGGYIKRVEFKNIDRYTPKDAPKEKLVLFDKEATTMSFDMELVDYTVVNTKNCFFTASVDTLNVSKGSQVLTLRLYPYQKADSTQTAPLLDKNSYLEYCYTFYADDYKFDYSIRFVNLSKYIRSKKNFTLDWAANLTNVEKNYEYERDATTLYYMDNLNEVDNLEERSSDKEDFSTELKWVSFKQQFFTSIIIAGDHSFSRAHLEVVAPEAEDARPSLKNTVANLGFGVADVDSGKFDMSMYFGPNQYKLLEPYELNLEKQVPLGWGFFLLHWINRFVVIPVFNWLEAYGFNYGIIILILTFLLKIVLFPIAYKTYLSSARMRVLKPQIEEINDRYPKKDDAMKKQQATMALYKRAGVSPMSGCLPMLLQMPILIAMFRFFPSAYELRQQPFLWADDLSTYDSILDFSFNIPFYGDHVSLFTLLMTIATLVYTWLNNKMMAVGGGDQQKMMRIMMYIMPILFLGMFNSFSSALTYYYLLVNLITFLQMWIFRMAINEDKLHKKLLLNMEKPVKKTKWQLRMEEMVKQQQQMQKNTQKKIK
ncbi:MAG TPA: membrane protein insertase YidC [Bacteroidales bacterium]|nr:membrane protein insertase YidC [Bacteroidales bacterium]HPT51953.1 membrane protein insertase YidC [Bacteroidales bacterium]